MRIVKACYKRHCSHFSNGETLIVNSRGQGYLCFPSAFTDLRDWVFLQISLCILKFEEPKSSLLSQKMHFQVASNWNSTILKRKRSWCRDFKLKKVEIWNFKAKYFKIDRFKAKPKLMLGFHGKDCNFKPENEFLKKKITGNQQI